MALGSGPCKLIEDEAEREAVQRAIEAAQARAEFASKQRHCRPLREQRAEQVAPSLAKDPNHPGSRVIAAVA